MTSLLREFAHICVRKLALTSRHNADNSRDSFKVTKWQKFKFAASVMLTLSVTTLSQDFFYGIHIGAFICILIALCLLFWGLISFCEALVYYFFNHPIAGNCNGYVQEQLSSSRQSVGISTSENRLDISPPCRNMLSSSRQPVGISTSENPSDISPPYDMLSSSRQPVGISISESPLDVPPPYDIVANLSPNNNRQVLNILEAPPPYDKVAPDK